MKSLTSVYFLTLHQISSALCFSEIHLSFSGIFANFNLTRFFFFYLGKPHSFHNFTSILKSVTLYATKGELKDNCKYLILYLFSSSFTWKKNVCAPKLVNTEGNHWVHSFQFQTRVRTNSLVFFSHNQKDIFLRSLARFHLTVAEACTSTLLQTLLASYEFIFTMETGFQFIWEITKS